MSRVKLKAEMTVTELARAGGKARREALSPRQRSVIAQKAADARWYRDCDECHGSGEIVLGRARKIEPCLDCQGTGQVRR